jgi:hypothetical protein
LPCSHKCATASDFHSIGVHWPKPGVTEPMPEILVGDARALPLADESVDLIVTSPPYFGLRDYGVEGQVGAEPTPAEFIAALIECTREMVRVLKPSGSIFVNLGDKYAGNNLAKSARTNTTLDGPPTADYGRGNRQMRSLRVPGIPGKSLMMLPERYRIAAVDELGLIARAVLIWSKPNGLPESVTDRVRRSHEDWVHLTKSPRYFAAVDEIREPHTMRPQREQLAGASRTPAGIQIASRGRDCGRSARRGWPTRWASSPAPSGPSPPNPCACPQSWASTTSQRSRWNGRAGSSRAGRRSAV